MSRRSPAAAAAAAVEAAVDPTFVPRDPAVRDGPWNAVDAGLVQTAQQQASALHGSSSSSSSAGSSSSSSVAASSAGVVLLGQTAEQLGELAKSMGQPAYRGKQLADGVLKGAKRVADIKGLPASFIAQLQEAGVKTGRSAVHHTVRAPDGTSKLLLQLGEGRLIEAVGIPAQDSSKERLTVCVSSQVGCPMRCTFCATGKGGFARNLTAHEIVDQVLAVSELHGTRASNVVFMGMGEPLLNLPNVVAAAALMQQQLGMSGRAITISTVGVPNAINRLAQHKLTATLAVSLHAPNQELRKQLVPSAAAYPLEALMQDCAAYFKATGRRVTFEYTLMSGTNDAPEHARELLALLRHYKLMSHVNLIPWNPVGESEFERPSRARVDAFKAVLERAGLPVSVRTTRGLEAAAACGQLRNMHQKQGLSNPQQLT
ncbi:hypothetical protein OEZ85_014098 [Tetradesmus obliquus]|uniref:Radical SAM core domain-containing protein n=1 Tax=Tetradesmus obliquus TaxID=3088 RepID=A0ABY8U6X1_TETOB|nr:hypothetical protein OEZ85_014098 [Tetradesmus obliquus]